MQDDESQDVSCVMTKEELERTMRTLEPVYDLVRIVDPSITQGRTLNEEGTLGCSHRCFGLLSKDHRCKDCISARTIAGHGSVSKFEVANNHPFFISTRYVEVDGKPLSLELVKMIDNDPLVANGARVGGMDKNASIPNFQELVENTERTRYASTIPGTMSRAYLDEGIEALEGRHVALLRVVMPQIGEEERQNILELVARCIIDRVRSVETIVHYEENTFAILFEGIPSALFRTRLEQIRTHALKELRQYGALKTTDIYIAGVSRHGKIHDLIAEAAETLEQTVTGTQRVVVIMSKEEVDVRSGLMEAPEETPALGTHAPGVDALTRLPSAHIFRHTLQERIEQLGEGQTLQVVHLDVENFKAFNREYGLSDGDVLLVNLVEAIREQFPYDLVARTGIDMFVVVTQAEDTKARVAQVRRRMNHLRRDVPLSLKAGVCTVRDPGMEARSALDEAKIACDSIKGKYDQAFREFDERLEHQVSMRDHLVKSLDEAIKNDYIKPYYQVIVRSFTGSACSVEALARWEDPNFGLLSPGDVIPTLEHHHLIHKHDLHIVRCVCRDLRARLDAGKPVVPASVNLSRLDFELCDIFQEVEDAVEEYGISRNLLDIEVTESTLDKSSGFFRPQVERFRDAGYEIWMDDFGSGYSSLNLLKDYSFDVLKIDMAFLRGLETNQTSKEILSTIVDMAKRIGIRTLAEGVENQAQYAFLRSIGCEMIQGYLFSRPSPLDRIDLDANMSVEAAGDRSYFESIGRVNLLSQQPTETLSASGSEMPQRGMPLAVVEWDGTNARFFTTNEAFEKYARSRGYANMAEAQVQLQNDEAMVQRFRAVGEGVGCDKSIRLIARNNDSVALLLSPLHELA